MKPEVQFYDMQTWHSMPVVDGLRICDTGGLSTWRFIRGSIDSSFAPFGIVALVAHGKFVVVVPPLEGRLFG